MVSDAPVAWALACDPIQVLYYFSTLEDALACSLMQDEDYFVYEEVPPPDFTARTRYRMQWITRDRHVTMKKDMETFEEALALWEKYPQYQKRWRIEPYWTKI